jgi:hypothetical protein
MSAERNDLQRHWEAALAHAQIESDAARLYLVGGKPIDRSAIWIEPGSEIFRTPEFPLTSSQLTDANHAARRDLHRIIAFSETSPIVLAARMRHELEHARQWDQDGSRLTRLEEAIQATHGNTYGGLAWSGLIYNTVPSEADANAAAAQFAAAHFPTGELESLIGEGDGVLFRSPASTDSETLGLRMLCHIAGWRTEFESHLDSRALNRTSFLDDVVSSGSALWIQFANDVRLQDLNRVIRNAKPTKEELESLTPRGLRDRWAEVTQPAFDAAERALDIAAQ